MAVRILATGDIHIGRRPTRIRDPELEERASAARMWEAIVDRAVSERVDAVLLSGDIVDHDNCFYEATGPLERGILRLADAGVSSCAVAGNHDWDVFPRILEQLDSPLFHFLGKAGRWEESFLERNGQPLLRIVGWSFPARFFGKNPLVEYGFGADAGLPTVGLLHADVDVPTSEYAPIRLSELQARDLSLWVLGHVHKPQYWASDSGTPVLYPGSPQALSPKEPGPHGPWLIEFDGPHMVVCRQLPMSRVRYEQCQVDLSGASTSDAFETRVNDAVSAALKSVTGDEEAPELISLQLNLVGATPICAQIDSLARSLGELERSSGAVRAQIDKHINRTRPVADLEELSQHSDPAGTLARTLIALEQGEENEVIAALLRDAVAQLIDVHRAPAYVALVDEDLIPDSEAARQVMLQVGRQLLDTLRAQVPSPQEAIG